MNRANIKSSYALALLWVAAFLALAVSVNLITDLVFVDFVHGNPNRSQSNALITIMLFLPIFSMITVIGVWLVFGSAQIFQAILTYLLFPRLGRLSFLFVGFMLPFAAILTWYSFDYLTPSNVGLAINESSDWIPYQHGISPLRFLAATGAQAIVTVFTLTYCNTGYLRFSRKQLLLTALVVSILSGIAWGYRGAKIQYQFIDHPNRASPDDG